MLDIMRRKKRLKAVLWLVIVSLGLGMLLLFVPGANVGNVGFDTSAASVDGDSIPMQDLVDTYRRAVENYSAGGRNKTDFATLKAIGLPKQALDSLINVRVVGYAAKQLGLDVSPEEVRQAVETYPNLQDQNGFIGIDRYKALLAANGISITQFEDSLRSMLVAKKVRNLVTDSMIVTDSELKDNYLRASQEAKIAFVTLKRDDFRKKVSPAEADLRAYFEAHKDSYRIKEQRRAQYLLIPLSSLAPTIPVTEQEIKEAWAKQGGEETVDAAHILFEVKDPSKDAEVKAKAEAILKRAKAGENFAELAKQYSGDTGSAKMGGELGPFSRGHMVPEFEKAAFALKPGEISDLVKTQFGYHIIKVSKHEIPTLESNRASIERGIQITKASEMAKKKAAEAERLAQSQKDLNAVAKALSGTPTEVKETGFFAKDSQAFTSGISQQILDEVFQLKELNAVGKAVEHPLGYAIPKLLEIHLPKPPDFNEARAAVERDYVDAKAAELMQQEAKAFADEARKAGDIEKAAQKDKIAVKTSSPFKRDTAADPDLGYVPQISAAAFDLEIGAVSSPIQIGAGTSAVVLQVKSRTPFDEAAFNKEKPAVKERVLSMWRDAYFEEYIRKLTDELEKKGKIRTNPRALDQLAQYQSRY